MNPPAALQRRLEYVGPAIFSYGFRPFFLGGATWAALSVALWLPQYFGELSLPTAFNPLDWHIHEMIYGYVAATIAGFLLTAIPNWTGRLPVNGYPLAGLFALWLAGRVAIAGSAVWGQWIAAAIDVAFLHDIRGNRAARNHRRQQLAQSPRPRHARRADCRQHRFPRGGNPSRQRRLWRSYRHCRVDRAHHAGGRTRRPEFHQQLAGAEQPRPASDRIFTIRRDSAWRQRAFACVMDCVATIRRLRRPVDDRGRAPGNPSSSAGPEIALSPIVSFWFSTLLMPSCRLASCCRARRSCGLLTGRSVPAFTPGPPAPLV